MRRRLVQRIPEHPPIFIEREIGKGGRGFRGEPAEFGLFVAERDGSAAVPTPKDGLGVRRRPPRRPHRFEPLRGAGYRTALIGKRHLGYLPRFGPLKSGYDEFFGVMGGFTGYYTHKGETPVDRIGYVTDMLSDRAAEHVASASGPPDPFFLCLHYTAPHWPWSAPSVEEAAREREVTALELSEGGSPRI